MLELFQQCFLALAATYLAVIAHEAGHALVGKALGFVVTSVGLGTARPFLILRMGGTRLYLGFIQPFQGITFAFLSCPCPGWRRLAGYAAGGIVANAICAVTSLYLAQRTSNDGLAIFYNMFAAINASFSVINLIPVRVRVGGGTLRSDGMLLLEAIRTGSITPRPPDVIQAVSGCRRLWQSIDDRLMHRLCTSHAALSWIDLGSTTKAESLLSESAAIDVAHPYIDWLEAVVRTNLALAKGELVEAKAALGQAERHCWAATAEGRYMLDLLRANLLQNEGKPGEALATFERLSIDPVSQRRQEFGLSVLTHHLRAACIAGDPDAVAALRARFEERRQRAPSDLRDLHIYGALARFASSRGADARDDYRRVLKAIAGLAALWRNAEDKAAFVSAQKGLIEGARQLMDAESVAPLVEAIETDQPAHALLARIESYRRWSVRLMLINVSSFVPLVLLAFAIGRPHGASALFLAVLLVLFSLLGGFYFLLDFILGERLPSLKQSSGIILLSLALAPWFGGLFFAMFPP